MNSSPSSSRRRHFRFDAASWSKHSASSNHNASSSALDDLNEDDVSICSVCFDGAFSDKNPIIFCDRCNIGVHRYCYGICRIPSDHSEWLCQSCFALRGGPLSNDQRQHAQRPQCCLCPVVGGTFMLSVPLSLEMVP